MFTVCGKLVVLFNKEQRAVKNVKIKKDTENITMQPQTYFRTEVPEKIVIFRHKAASIKIDSQIRYDAVYIKDPDLSDKNTAAAYYKSEIDRAANSGKSYIVMNYNKIIGDYFNTLLSDTKTYNYKNWIFLAFFHDDTDTPMQKTRKNKNAIDAKADTLLSMQDCPFIKKFIVPCNATITYHSILPLMLENWGIIGI